jgi:hypothetical protein
VDEVTVPGSGAGFPGFEPDFDDTEWTDGWRYVAIAQVPTIVHPSGYRTERRALDQAQVFGRSYRLSAPLDCSFLYDPDGRLWMSNTPQERIMMYNNGLRSQGQVLVGGLGLGLYPQYAEIGAAGEATGFTIIEESTAVRAIVEPMLRAVLSVPLEVRTGDIEVVLSGPVTTRYDTIFLDTWDTLDAAHLPAINRLRDLALRHLTPEGHVLLWGYRWIVRLYEEACRQLLGVAPGERRSWLTNRAKASRQATALLGPVMDRFRGQVVGDMEWALTWCRRYAVQIVA